MVTQYLTQAQLYVFGECQANGRLVPELHDPVADELVRMGVMERQSFDGKCWYVLTDIGKGLAA